jgi:hypothetical protein
MLPVSLSAQQTSSTAAAAVSGATGEFSSVPYLAGEKLTYTVSFSNFTSAGHIELFNAGRGRFFNREGFELRARVQSVGVVRAALYAIDSEYTSYVDPQTGLPYRTRVQNLEGVGAAQAAAIAAGQPPPAVEATPTTYDLLSALYRLRAMPLAAGATYRLSAQGESAQYEVEARVVGRETVKTAAGSFNAVVTQLRARGAASDYRPRIYFTDDERHVPVLLTAKLKTGELRAELASSELIKLAPPPAATGVIAAQPQSAQPLDAPPPPGRVVVPSPAGGSDGALPAGSTGEESADLSGLPFKVGEQLNFNFFLGTSPQPVGIASYHVRARNKYAGRDGLWLSASMVTTNALQQLFPVADKIETYVDAKTLLPFRSQLQISEGNHRLQGVVSLDQERGAATVTDGSTIEIPVGTYDLVSVIYALRSFDLTPPKRNAVSLLINKRPRTLFITSIRRETIELGGKSIPAYQLALATDEPQGNRLNIRLWVGSDRRRLPLRLTATTPLGPVRADLSIIPLTTQ